MRRAPTILDRMDGVSFELSGLALQFAQFQYRALDPLNVESRGSEALMHAKTAELLALLTAEGAVAADH